MTPAPNHSELLDDDYCFACGGRNPFGLKLDFYFAEEDVLATRFVPEPHHQGFRGVLHGGIAATVVDDLMSNHGSRATGNFYLTAELNVRYREPLPVGEELVARSEIVDQRHRVMKLEARLALAEEPEEDCFTAEGRFMEVEPEETDQVQRAGGA